MTKRHIRIGLIEPATTPELADIEKRISAERGRVSVLYRALLNAPHIASGWEQLLTAVRNKSTLRADLRELIILRVAILNNAPYEFEAHAPIAARLGVSETKLDALKLIPLAVVFEPLERLVLEATDALTRDVALSDALYARLEAAFAPQQLVEVVTTIAAYNMVSRFLSAFHIGH